MIASFKDWLNEETVIKNGVKFTTRAPVGAGYVYPDELVQWEKFTQVHDFFKENNIDIEDIVIVDIRVSTYHERRLDLFEKLIDTWEKNGGAKPVKSSRSGIVKPFPLYMMSKIFSDEYDTFFLSKEDADRIEHEIRGHVHGKTYGI